MTFYSPLSFSHFVSSKNYAVQLEKMTSSDFRDKGEPDNEKSKKSLKAVDKPEEVIHKSPGYFKFPKWEYQKWNQVKKDFGEGHTPIDKIEGEYKMFCF